MKSNITIMEGYKTIKVIDNKQTVDDIRFVAMDCDTQQIYDVLKITTQQELRKAFNQEGYFFTGSKILDGRPNYCFTKKLN